MATISLSCPSALSLATRVSPSIYCNTCNSLRPNKTRYTRRGFALQLQALRDENSQPGYTIVYEGVYGPWTIEESDIQEVLFYRGGLVASALSFVAAASSAFLPDGSSPKFLIQENLDASYAVGAGSLGLSLALIHIYVTPIKRTLQILWATGVVGSIALYLNFASPAHQGLVHYMVANPWSVWLIGPLFASLIGLVFKEGLCYGKLEAFLLIFVIPILLLGHFSGLMDDQLKLALLGGWMTLFTIFASRKFTQPIKDDIGDKSVFMFNALSEEERSAFLNNRKNQFQRSE